MKRIVVFCDGTWNRPENDQQTHVERLAHEVPKMTSDGVTQVSKYFEGVGAGRGTGWLRRNFDQYGGGAFGWGLAKKIEDAYRWIAENYAPGDEIYIFGFSRGAYTARSLGGLIRASGLPTSSNLKRIPEALNRYKDRDPTTHPSTDESAEFRWGFSPHVYTGRTEKEWREREQHPVGTRLRITYLGVWDTVGALGVPGVFGTIARPFNAKYLFHDATLSSSVTAGRHALATDERRLFYPPTVWKNLDVLNGNDLDPAYRQKWFPGDHGMVGGSGGDKQLSEYTMQWIIEGAQSQGLEINAAFCDLVKSGRAFGGALSNKRRRILGRDRRLEQEAQDVSRCTLHRLKFGDARGEPYDPGTLEPIRSTLAPLLPDVRSSDVP